MYQSSTRAPTLHQWDITDASALPLSQDKRKFTDVICIILAVLFVVVLLVTAIVLHNGSNLSRSQFPTDSKGIICALDARNGSKNYPFLFFNDVREPLSRRFCVQDCPQQGVSTSCFEGSCQLNYYPNYPSNGEFGPICLPTDSSLKALVLDKAGLAKRFNSERAINMLLIGLGVAFGLALAWIGMVEFRPRWAVWIAFVLAIVLLVIASIVFFAGAGTHFADNKGWAIFFGIFFIVLMILLISYVCLHKKQLQLCGCFLEVARDCFEDNLASLLYLLLFIALSILFIILLVYEYLAFSSSRDLTLNGLYYQNNSNPFLIFLLVVQAIWGFSFFRDAFNYILSGIADEWYFHKLNMLCYPFKRLFFKNLGSVIGGSLLTGFFYLPAMLISFITPNTDFTLCNLFDLARSDVYAYVYLTGNSYCPSSRQTQYLCKRSRICRQNENTTSIYALAARLSIALAAVLIVYLITKGSLVDGEVPLTVLGGVFLACLYITCYCSDIHAVIAEALVVCFLTEYDLEEGWSFKEMRVCPEKLSKLVIDIQEKGRQWQ